MSVNEQTTLKITLYALKDWDALQAGLRLLGK